MLLTHPYSRTDLFRYFDEQTEVKEKIALEQHLIVCESCQSYLSFLREFRQGLAEITEEEFTSREPCPDAWTLTSFEADDVDEETARHIRAHLLFCDDCTEVYQALRRARPKRVEVVLRSARGSFEALRVLGDEALVIPSPVAITMGVRTEAFVAPFRIAQAVRADGEASTITVRVETGLRTPEQVRLVVECEPSRSSWRAHLVDAEQNRIASLSLLRPQIEISSELDYGFYSLEINKDDERLLEFAFTIEPFSLPEAVQLALENLERSDDSRAIAILDSALARYPEDQQLWELRALSLILLSIEMHDPDPELIAEVRNLVLEAVRNITARFGSSAVAQLATRVIEPTGLQPAGAPLPPSSFAVLHAIELLRERLPKEHSEMPVLREYDARYQRIAELIEHLRTAFNAIRHDTLPDFAEKSEAADNLLEQFDRDLDDAGISSPTYSQFFSDPDRLGEDCWLWLGYEVQKLFASAEDLHRDFGSRPAIEMPDFTPALFQLCRGLELLVKTRLRSVCIAIMTTINTRRDLATLLRSRLPTMPDDAFHTGTRFSLTKRKRSRGREDYSTGETQYLRSNC